MLSVRKSKIFVSMILALLFTTTSQAQSSGLNEYQMEHAVKSGLQAWLNISYIPPVKVKYIGLKSWDVFHQLTDYRNFSGPEGPHHSNPYRVDFHYRSTDFTCYAVDFYNHQKIVFANCNTSERFHSTGGRASGEIDNVFPQKLSYENSTNFDKEFSDLKKSWASEYSRLSLSSYLSIVLNTEDYFYVDYKPIGKYTVTVEKPKRSKASIEDYLNKCIIHAREQSSSTTRNSLLWSCHREVSDSIGYDECRVLVDEMSGAYDQDEMRLRCVEMDAEDLTYERCLSIADEMNKSYFGDLLRQACYETFSSDLTYEQCRSLADKMNGDHEQNLLRQKCINH